MPKPLKTADWWYHLESNQGHTDFQSVALPTELWYRFSNAVQIYGKISFFKIRAKNLLSHFSTFLFQTSPTSHTITILINLKFTLVLALKKTASETNPLCFCTFVPLYTKLNGIIYTYVTQRHTHYSPPHRLPSRPLWSVYKYRIT